MACVHRPSSQEHFVGFVSPGQEDPLDFLTPALMESMNFVSPGQTPFVPCASLASFVPSMEPVVAAVEPTLAPAAVEPTLAPAAVPAAVKMTEFKNELHWTPAADDYMRVVEQTLGPVAAYAMDYVQTRAELRFYEAQHADAAASLQQAKVALEKKAVSSVRAAQQARFTACVAAMEAADASLTASRSAYAAVEKIVRSSLQLLLMLDVPGVGGSRPSGARPRPSGSRQVPATPSQETYPNLRPQVAGADVSPAAVWTALRERLAAAKGKTFIYGANGDVEGIPPPDLTKDDLTGCFAQVLVVVGVDGDVLPADTFIHGGIDIDGCVWRCKRRSGHGATIPTTSNGKNRTREDPFDLMGVAGSRTVTSLWCKALRVLIWGPASLLKPGDFVDFPEDIKALCPGEKLTWVAHTFKRISNKSTKLTMQLTDAMMPGLWSLLPGEAYALPACLAERIATCDGNGDGDTDSNGDVDGPGCSRKRSADNEPVSSDDDDSPPCSRHRSI